MASIETPPFQALTYVPTLEYTPTILGRLGIIEVSFQRSKSAQRIGKGKSKKEGPTFAPINETMAKQFEVETLTRYVGAKAIRILYTR